VLRYFFKQSISRSGFVLLTPLRCDFTVMKTAPIAAPLLCDFTVMKTAPIEVETCNRSFSLTNVTDTKYSAYIRLTVLLKKELTFPVKRK
jgi:hypothetical protein